MAERAEQAVRVADSHTPSATLLEPDPSFLVENYDPYMEPIVEDVDPKEVMEPPPTWWERLVIALAG